LAITMEEAVTKPIVRRGRGDFTEGRSATALIVESTIPKLLELANCFGIVFKFIIKPAPGGRLVYWLKTMSAESYPLAS
jgi:hypothetical protein